MTKRIHSFSFILSGFFLLSDQLVKNYFTHHQDFSAYFIEPWLGLEYFQNPGVAFGIPIPNAVTLVYTPLVLLGLLLFLFKGHPSFKKILGLWLITFGALSNFIDRISVEFTIDYIRVITSIFNIADIMIVAGAFLVLFEELKKKK
jgi:lipoprotein signal peptidase